MSRSYSRKKSNSEGAKCPMGRLWDHLKGRELSTDRPLWMKVVCGQEVLEGYWVGDTEKPVRSHTSEVSDCFGSKGGARRIDVSLVAIQ